MTTQIDTIRIYVASLADYNAGRLHGVWIDATQDAYDIQAEVNKMLAASKEPIAEEWAIHDYEGFYGLKLGEWESFDKVSEWATAIAEHGEAYAIWADDTDDTDVQTFEYAYRGEHATMADFAEEFYTELGEVNDSYLMGFIDWERVGREMETDGYNFEKGHVFSNR
jgi:antirestriction protein